MLYVISPELDYRATQNCRVEFIEEFPNRELTGVLGKLLSQLGLDFAAADFKTDAGTGTCLAGITSTVIPATSDEEALCREALETCPTAAIHDDGDVVL